MLFVTFCGDSLMHGGRASGSPRDSLCRAPSGRPLAGKVPYRACRNGHRRSQTALVRPRATRLFSSGISGTAAEPSYSAGKRFPPSTNRCSGVRCARLERRPRSKQTRPGPSVHGGKRRHGSRKFVAGLGVFVDGDELIALEANFERAEAILDIEEAIP